MGASSLSPSATASARVAFAKFVAMAFTGSAVVFLIASGLLSAWEGRLAVRGAPGRGAAVSALVVTESGARHVVRIPEMLAEEKAIPRNDALRPPVPIRDDAPTATKKRFSLHFEVASAGSEPALVATTSPAAVGLAALVAVLSIIVRNLSVSGVPWDIQPRPKRVDVPMVPGAPAKRKGPVSQKGPPPPRPSSRPR